MHALLTQVLVGATVALWLGGGAYLASRAARERAREAGGSWLGHLLGREWRRVKSAEGRTWVGRADLWALAGVPLFALVLPLLLALLDALLGSGG